jgi:DNA transformation protein
VAVSPEYRAYVEDRLGRVVPLRSRAMFGGVGFYAGDFFFALIDDDILYFKVDDDTRSRYVDRGMGPFLPPGETSSGYYQVPDGVLEDTGELVGWTEEAVEVARRAKTRKVSRKKR